MEEPSKTIPYAKCSCCDKPTFADFLNESMMREYCAEVRRTKSHYLPRKGQRNAKQHRRTIDQALAATVDNKGPTKE